MSSRPVSYTHLDVYKRQGSNGFCGGDYLCTGLKGYDAPLGLGSPKGLNGL